MFRACCCDGSHLSFWQATPDGVRVAVKVQPKSRRPGLQGIVPDLSGTRLRIGVRDAAEDGRATLAACVALAEAMGVATHTVSVLQGVTSRQKLLRVAGDPNALSAILEAISTSTGTA